MTDPILIGKGLGPAYLLPAMANRHGLVAGATGTGKTVTLQRLAESFSRIGVPVFMADVKGDLAGIGQPGGGNAKVEARVAELGLGAGDFSTQACPVTLWDILGDQGHPVRTTLSEMGPPCCWRASWA
jgi:DNA helicase HerA-like ATPase